MMDINFKIATSDGIVEQRGELIEHNGYQYALHHHLGLYKATELSTGFLVCLVPETETSVNSIGERDHLIQQIKTMTITPEMLNEAKIILELSGNPYPLNPRFDIQNK